MSQSKQIICVGAVYIDTILTIPHFPDEDSKLRAQSLTRRRGGNTANTLEVLSSLTSALPSPSPPSLHLISVLPAPTSPDTNFIRSTLPAVNTSRCILRPETEAASSYILSSAATHTRTIISSNPLAEMTPDEFSDAVSPLLPSTSPPATTIIHFEGRDPPVLHKCISALRNPAPSASDPRVLISIECEKPTRDLLPSAAHADIVFFSKLWATHHGFSTPRAFLASQIPRLRRGALACCTWGAEGAVAVRIADSDDGEDVWAETEAWRGGEVVDSVGAGDTFIAGMLFCLVERAGWGLGEMVGFANEVAGRKVVQEGFGGLGGKMGGR